MLDVCVLFLLGLWLDWLQADPSCENVQELYFAEAVVDNYAPIQEQQLWSGKGQRYFFNDEFWGGPGSPIFVFIGGNFLNC